MFGMSSEEFWEQSPQLYWAYRIFYYKQMEVESEKMKQTCWLQGKITNIALSVALNNGFNKEKIEFPKYEEMFGLPQEKQELSPEERRQRVNLKVQEEFNAWARF